MTFAVRTKRHVSAVSQMAAANVGHERLRSNPFFAGRNPLLLDVLMAELSIEIYVEGATILKEGDIGNTMHFLNKGRVEVLVANGTKKVSEMGAGSVYGEMVLLGVATKRTATVKALELCDCRVLSGKAFRYILRRFPEEEKFFAKMARQRKEKLFQTEVRRHGWSVTSGGSTSRQDQLEAKQHFYEKQMLQRRLNAGGLGSGRRDALCFNSPICPMPDMEGLVLPRNLQLTPSSAKRVEAIDESPFGSDADKVDESPAEGVSRPRVGAGVVAPRETTSVLANEGAGESSSTRRGQSVRVDSLPPSQHCCEEPEEMSGVEALFESLLSRGSSRTSGVARRTRSTEKFGTRQRPKRRREPRAPALSLFWDRRQGLSERARTFADSEGFPSLNQSRAPLTARPADNPAAVCGLLQPF